MESVRLQAGPDGVRVDGGSYRWEWERGSDRLTLRDRTGATIATQRLQPCVRVAPPPRQSTGRCAGVAANENRLEVTYEGVNESGRLTLALRFHPGYYVIESVTYQSERAEAVVALAYACDDSSGQPLPNGEADYYVIPGANQTPEQYILPAWGLANARISLGCFGIFTGTFTQQPFLPHHLFCLCSGVRSGGHPMHMEKQRTGAVCMGLAGIPDGNLLLEVVQRRFSPVLNFRGDLWGHWQGPGTLRFDTPWVIAAGDTWYEAIRAYFRVLCAEGYARRKRPEEVPPSAYWPEYDSWGDQCARGAIRERLDQESLEAIYRDYRASGMRARLFVIDDRWERAPGALEHDERRFPAWDAFLDRVRADGHEIGLWTAFPRCSHYRDYGLEADAVLRTPGGEPYRVQYGDTSTGWFIFDPTHPRVEQHLRERARALVRRYRPRLIKIDFGYEIPTPDVAAPHDLRWAGERLFQRFLEVIIPAIREADPEVTVQYYALSPLLAAHYDHFSFDDMWLAKGLYHDAFNKRAVLASLCGEFGLVPYGSTGYDWESAPQIWFDTPVVGTLGSLVPFAGDERGERARPEQIARYNGIARLTRQNPYFTVEFLDAELDHFLFGPRAHSWARLEEGEAVVVALRPRAGPAGRRGDRYRDLVATDCAVVVGALAEGSLATTSRVGVVPYGDGTIRLGRMGTVQARAHLLGGASLPLPVSPTAQGVSLPLHQRAPDGTPIEIIEVDFR